MLHDGIPRSIRPRTLRTVCMPVVESKRSIGRLLPSAGIVAVNQSTAFSYDPKISEARIKTRSMVTSSDDIFGFSNSSGSRPGGSRNPLKTQLSISAFRAFRPLLAYLTACAAASGFKLKFSIFSRTLEMVGRSTTLPSPSALRRRSCSISLNGDCEKKWESAPLGSVAVSQSRSFIASGFIFFIDPHRARSRPCPTL